MENRKVMMKQELLTQSILISDLEKRVDKANLDAERARMAYEDLSSSVIERLQKKPIFTNLEKRS